MPKKERDEVLAELASRIFSTMVEETLMDVVLESHQAISRSKTVCPVCHTYCKAAHTSGPSGTASQPAASSSRLPTPSDEAKATDQNSPAGTGMSTPTNGKSNGNILLECVNCKRQIASNRYASHLGDCMGLANSRRGAVRSATTKTKLASDAGRSASPYVASENGALSDDGKTTTSGRNKAKSRTKRADEAEFNLHRKRPGSPTLSPTKKSKKAKTTGSPISRVKGDTDVPGSPSTNSLPLPPSSSLTRVPSKLRESSIVSSVNRDRRSSSPESPSRYSSPARSVSTLASAPSMQSPTLAASKVQKPKGGRNGKPPPAPPRRLSPPRPPPPPPIIRMPEPDYLVDVEGDETGSSTDTDSS
ncbi:uncharacterized protein LAESUDRAFT_725528 [Laetiporus sulphureus 93-53]|uniref:SAGA-associated factor 11 n=1 Tax=Laetiporus sulphureus 93-53 TaxID=1314785 RepID=A0A165ED20_9APHY|nr:uncharacterized protein LAESUDRAFT_725528 [Laetiporus sulphureus 93-53]KZT06767.1 hypothetical protein LAESUDRAFT_725528 [Laetiporus sulphureus 93-53]